MPLTKADLLNEAAKTVGGRGKNYGRPEDNFARIARHWNAFFSNRFGSLHIITVTPGDVAQMMALMKIARLEYDPKHADSWIDLAGYAACGAEIETASPIEQRFKLPPHLQAAADEFVGLDDCA